MRILEKKSREFNFEEYRQRSALESDYTQLVRESAVVVVDGKIRAIYQDLDELGMKSASIVKALQTIKYQAGQRSRGLTSYSRIFGYAPRLEFRQNFCHSASLAVENPKEHATICSYATEVARVYQLNAPETYSDHLETATKVLDSYRIEGSPFTSGIANKNSALKYHFDSGNFNDVYSCMLGFKSNVLGGYLALPEFDVAFEIKDNSVFIFDGQNILHGVTPIKYLTEDAYRYTVVYYSLKRMWECKVVGEEIERIRNIRQEVERRRARGELAPAVVRKLEGRRKKESLGEGVR